MLSLVGCAFGLALAFGGIRLFAVIVPQGFPELLRHNPIDGRVLAFALAISVASSLLFGLIPALQASRVNLSDVLKEGGRGGERLPPPRPQRAAGGGGVARDGAAGRRRADDARLHAEQGELPGFSTERLVTGEILLGGTRYFDKTPQDMNLVTPQVEAFYDQVLERVRAIPGVQRAGIISKLPLQVRLVPVHDRRPARPDSRAGEPRADVNEVDAQALDTLGIRLLRGRGIRESDVAGAPWVAVVNQTFADRHFPGQDPLGRAIRLSMGDPGPALRRRAPAADDRRRGRRRHVPVVLRREAGRHLHSVPAARLAVRARGRVDPHPQGAGDPDRGRAADARAGACGQRWPTWTATRRCTTSRRWTSACAPRPPSPTAASSRRSSRSSARSRSCWRWWASTA